MIARKPQQRSFNYNRPRYSRGDKYQADARENNGTRFNVLANEVEMEPTVLMWEKPNQEGKRDNGLNGEQLAQQGKKSQNGRQAITLGPQHQRNGKAHEKSGSIINQKFKRVEGPETSIVKSQTENTVESSRTKQAKEKLRMDHEEYWQNFRRSNHTNWMAYRDGMDVDLFPQLQVHNSSSEEINFLRKLQEGRLISNGAKEPPDLGDTGVNRGKVPSSEASDN